MSGGAGWVGRKVYICISPYTRMGFLFILLFIYYNPCFRVFMDSGCEYVRFWYNDVKGGNGRKSCFFW